MDYAFIGIILARAILAAIDSGNMSEEELAKLIATNLIKIDSTKEVIKSEIEKWTP